MSDVRRFACTMCGKCCDRSPEVELSEAAALADVFVFRLMFRLYSLPRQFDRSGSDRAELFYQKKRLLAAHAARAYPKKVMRDGKAVEHMHYLMISALALDTRSGACAALDGARCSIHARRPLACRTVPFHYSRTDALAERDFDAFVSSAAYVCNTGADAPVVLERGRIVDEDTLAARSQALAVAEADRPWKEAIVRRMKTGSVAGTSLPDLNDVEANAGLGALTASMRVGWQVGADAGLIGRDELARLVRLQLQTIERELTSGGCNANERGILAEMRMEYRAAAALQLRG
jgi:Fe-S-cluster containining protein